MSERKKVPKTLSIRGDLLRELEQLILKKYGVFIKGMLSLEVNNAIEQYVKSEKQKWRASE